MVRPANTQTMRTQANVAIHVQEQRTLSWRELVKSRDFMHLLLPPSVVQSSMLESRLGARRDWVACTVVSDALRQIVAEVRTAQKVQVQALADSGARG